MLFVVSYGVKEFCTENSSVENSLIQLWLFVFLFFLLFWQFNQPVHVSNTLVSLEFRFLKLQKSWDPVDLKVFMVIVSLTMTSDKQA